MKTVLYFEWIRKKRTIIRQLAGNFLLFAAMFVVCLIVDKVIPQFNHQYMRWPDMIKNFIGTAMWDSRLYINMWQLTAVFYPIYFVCMHMYQMSCGIIEEKRLETTVCLHNMNINRRTIFWGKTVFWTGMTFGGALLLFVENTLFALILQTQNMIPYMVRHYGKLFLISVIMGSIALFLSSYRKREGESRDVILGAVIVSFLIAKLPALFLFMSEMLTATNRPGALCTNLEILSRKTEALSFLCPVVWSGITMEVNGVYWIGGAIITVVMMVAGASIYSHGKVMD